MASPTNTCEYLLCAWPCPGCFEEYDKGQVMASVLEVLRPELGRQADCGGAEDPTGRWCVCRAKGVVDNY